MVVSLKPSFVMALIIFVPCFATPSLTVEIFSFVSIFCRVLSSGTYKIEDDNLTLVLPTGHALRFRFLDNGAIFDAEKNEGWAKRCTPERTESADNLPDGEFWGRATVADVQKLIEQGLDVNARLGQCSTLLMSAVAQSASADVIQTLIEAGADVNAKNRIGMTALMVAALSSDSDKITTLVAAGADVNARDYAGTTPLMYAMEIRTLFYYSDKNPNVIIALAQAGADASVNSKDEMTCLLGNDRSGCGSSWFDRRGEWSTLTVAIKDDLGLEVIKALIEAGADVNFTIDNPGSILHTAVYNNQPVAIIEALIEAGADVNARDSSGETVLMRAVSSSKLETILLLLEAGADINAKANDGSTALLHVSRSYPDVEALDEHIAIIEALIKAGADVNANDADGWTALMTTNVPGVISLLLQAGADVNAKSNDGFTALMKAASVVANEEVVLLLLEAGADAKVVNNEGKTALDLANRFGTLIDTEALAKLEEASR
jgi:ankyrin repeat protein